MDVGPDRDSSNPSTALSIPRYVATDISGKLHLFVPHHIFTCSENLDFFFDIEILLDFVSVDC